MKTYPDSRISSKAKYSKTGEFRPPKKGEFYLSGAIPEVYEAPNDLSTAFHIMCPVRPATMTPKRMLANLLRRKAYASCRGQINYHGAGRITICILSDTERPGFAQHTQGHWWKEFFYS